MKTRYFIIFFTQSTWFGRTHGHLTMSHDKYPNKEETENYLDKDGGLFCKSIITNIIELSKQDFEEWNR